MWTVILKSTRRVIGTSVSFHEAVVGMYHARLSGLDVDVVKMVV